MGKLLYLRVCITDNENYTYERELANNFHSINCKVPKKERTHEIYFSKTKRNEDCERKLEEMSKRFEMHKMFYLYIFLVKGQKKNNSSQIQ